MRHRVAINRHTPAEHQKRTLKKLMRKAMLTEFGKQHHFAKHLEKKDFTEQFREEVAVRNYNSMYNDWWHRSYAGESNVCWPGQVKYFALSSGTSEAASKHIPVTGDMIRAIKRTSLRQFLTLSHYELGADIFEKRFLMLGGSTHLHRRGNYWEGDLSGISASKIPLWFRHFYKPGRMIARERNWEAKLEEIVEQAAEWDIGYIAGVPAWMQILLEKIIAHHQLKTIHDLWPNLSVYVHGGVSFEPYRKGFESLVAKPLIYADTYLASEGFIAFQDDPHDQGMKLVTNNGIFFEFIPFDEKNFDHDGEMISNPETLTIDQVEENKPYALLLSTCAGAWRYLIGDVIKFTDLKKGNILISGRTKHFLSLCGEHLSVENMNRAIDLLSHELNVPIGEFTVAGIPYQNLFAHKWYVGIDAPVEPKILREKLDAHLCKLNDDYAVERQAALKDVQVEIIPTHYFFDWMKEHNKLGGQNKFPRVMKNHQFEEWEKFVAQHRLAG